MVKFSTAKNTNYLKTCRFTSRFFIFYNFLKLDFIFNIQRYIGFIQTKKITTRKSSDFVVLGYNIYFVLFLWEFYF